MSMAERLLEKQTRRYQFRILRRTLRQLIAPVWLGFALIDWIYKPEFFGLWIGLRAVCAAYWMIIPMLLRISSFRKNLNLVSATVVITAANCVNIMIFQTGGTASAYIAGVILVTVTGVELLRLDRFWSVVTNALCYTPTVVLMWAITPDGWTLRIAAVYSALLVGMAVLSSIFNHAANSAQNLWAHARSEVEKSLNKSRRSDFLKQHFPAEIRKMIEEGSINFGERQILPSAVVGFADITSSTLIGNSVDIMTDWEIKESFLQMATKRATESGLIVLTHTGDGFLFIANYFESHGWYYNLIAFYENLSKDFETYRQTLQTKMGAIDTGLKFGVAMGPSVIGLIGKEQKYFTIMGPTVNLAARLCGNAANNEIVISSRVWDVLNHVLIGWESTTQMHKLKGFDDEIKAVHIIPRSKTEGQAMCPDCGRVMTLVNTKEGFIDLRCPIDHAALAAGEAA